MLLDYFVVVQSLNCVWIFATPWTAACQVFLSFTTSRRMLKLSIESVMPPNHLVLCRPLLLLPSIFLSSKVFSDESAFRIRWPKYWSCSFSISSPKNIQDWSPLGWTGLISLQSKWLSRVFNTAILKHQIFSAQPSWWSNSHIHTWPLGKKVALTKRNFVGKVMTLPFNTLFRFSRALLSRRNCLLFQGCSHHLQWFWSPRKWSLSVFPLFPICLICSDGTGCLVLVNGLDLPLSEDGQGQLTSAGGFSSAVLCSIDQLIFSCDLLLAPAW